MLNINLSQNIFSAEYVIRMFFIVIDKNSNGICENISCRTKAFVLKLRETAFPGSLSYFFIQYINYS